MDKNLDSVLFLHFPHLGSIVERRILLWVGAPHRLVVLSLRIGGFSAEAGTSSCTPAFSFSAVDDVTHSVTESLRHLSKDTTKKRPSRETFETFYHNDEKTRPKQMTMANTLRLRTHLKKIFKTCS